MFKNNTSYVYLNNAIIKKKYFSHLALQRLNFLHGLLFSGSEDLKVRNCMVSYQNYSFHFCAEDFVPHHLHSRMRKKSVFSLFMAIVLICFKNIK